MAQQDKERAIFARFFDTASATPSAAANAVAPSKPSEATIFIRFFSVAPASPAVSLAKPDNTQDATAQAQTSASLAATAPTPAQTKPDQTPSAAAVNIAAPPATLHDTGAQSELDDTGAYSSNADNQQTFFTRMKLGLSRTRASFTRGMANILIGRKEIDDELLEDIETQMLVADVGIEATNQIMEALAERVSRKELFDANALYSALQQELESLLVAHSKPLVINSKHKPFVILMIGVNGVGKTTTIGKLAKRLQKEGKTVMLAAGDTFRAAAVEQLQVWGGRNNIPVIAQHTGADSASVIYDAMQAAQARKIDVLIADTAGRLHNKSNLMEELKKVKRVLAKLDPSAPHEVMLVMDAGTGQNAINQCQQFSEAIGVTGITLTKLDGTAKGGIVFSIAAKTDIPIRFIGVGEQIDDLRPFNAGEFVEALFANDD